MARTRRTFAMLTGLALSAGLLAGLSRAEPQDRAPAHSIPIVGISGVGSKVKQAGWVRVTSADALRTLWDEHAGVEPGAPQPPTVDFERCIVLACFDPEIGNASGVRIESIEPHERGLRIRYDVVQYQTASFGGGERPEPSKNGPFGLFVIDRTDAPILFEEDVQNLLGQPPIWRAAWSLESTRADLDRASRVPRGER